jgi:hypothetical protein
MTEKTPFIAAIELYCEGGYVAPGCAGPKCEFATDEPDPENHQCEPSFSWCQCDSCRSTLGGDRHPAFFIPDAWPKDRSLEPFEIDICTDCVMYWANGDEPDEWYANARQQREASL